MDVCPHQHAIIGCDSEQGDKADPDSDAQVDCVHLEKVSHVFSPYGKVHEPILPVQPKQDKSSCKSDKYAGEVDEGSGHRFKLEIEYQ